MMPSDRPNRASRDLQLTQSENHEIMPRRQAFSAAC
jgi:hypothetical protein